MPTEPKRPEVDLSESSVYNDTEATPAFSKEDIDKNLEVERLRDRIDVAKQERELEDAGLYEAGTRRGAENLDASTDEEIDALNLDLYQTDARSNTRDGSGRIVDDIAEEQLAELTEVGPDLDGEGAESIAPGSQDTSATLRRHHPNTEIGRADAIVEGNLTPGEQPSDETRTDPKVDEGPGA